MANDDIKLARVSWSQGQILRPEHLMAQEQSAQAELDLRVRSLGLAAWGVTQLAWDPSALRGEGKLVVRVLEVIMPSGEVLSLGRNLRLLGLPLALGSAPPVSVYLSRMPEESGEAGTSSGEELRAISPGAVHRRYKLALLSTEPPERALETMELARFSMGKEMQWYRMESFIPAVLDITRTPYFTMYLTSLRSIVRTAEERLTRELTIGFIGGDSIAGVKSVLRAVYELKGLLADIEAGSAPHPQPLFQMLRALYFELYFFQGDGGRLEPSLATLPYQHSAPAPALGRLMDGIQEIVSYQWSRAHIYEFAVDTSNGRFLAEDLPQEAVDSSEVYFIVQKPRIDYAFNVDWVKLASASRLDLVHRQSLVGLRLERLDLPPMAQGLGPNVEYYRVAQGDEWLYARRERRLAFYILEGFEALKVYLGWRAQ